MIKQEEIWDNLYKSGNKWNKEAQNIPDILKGKKVLEIGVGNGKTLKAIIKQKPKTVVAIDFSSEALEISKKLFTKVKFIKADVKNLPFSDNEFDVIICYYVLNNLLKKERQKAVSEMFRVIKDGGKILFEDFAIEDFRQKETKIVEENTIEKKNKLMCHFFTIDELDLLFKDFSGRKFELKESNPIKSRSELKRRVISGFIVK